MAAAIVVISAGIFVVGIMVGIIAIVSLGVRREERDFSLTREAPDQLTRGARAMTGLWVRQRSDIDPELMARLDTLV